MSRTILFPLILLALIASAGLVWFERASKEYIKSAPATETDRRHAAWDELLKRHVDQDGNVEYCSWKSGPDREQLLTYLRTAGGILDDHSSRDEQIAFWINLYNALTVEGILREYPTPSILDHVRPLGYNIWDDLQLEIAGKWYSLSDIEHRVLRLMKEPRIHFAIVCASRGCPRLRPEAYVGNRLDEQLTDNAKRFFARSERFQVSTAERTYFVSPILKWFAIDFGATDADRFDTIAPYLPISTDQKKQMRNWPVQYLSYDWSLNESPSRPDR